MTAADLIGIGITTKDRWDDLRDTLFKLKERGLDNLETVVIDDGSASPLPADFPRLFPRVNFMRSEVSLGLIKQRNRVVRALTRPLYLSLDDDSFPVAGSLDAAATWLMEHPKIIALGFTVISRTADIPVEDPAAVPYPVRNFIGCAFLLKREPFQALGEFEVLLDQYGEEPEFCMRAFQQGFETWLYPSVVVRHLVSQTGRKQARQCHFLSRTETLGPLWYFPRPYGYFRVLRFLPLFLLRVPSSRPHVAACLTGILSGILLYLRRKTGKQRLTPRQFRAWKQQRAPNDPR